MPVWETKCPARSRGWSSPGGELYKIMSVTILDRGEVCVFLKSGRYFSSVFLFKAANYMDVHQSFLFPLGKHSHSVAESSASRQRKWFLVLFPCVVLHQLVGSYGWAGGLRRPQLMSVPLCVQSSSASPLFSSAPLLRPAAAAGPKREPSRESHSTEGLLSPFSQHWQ